MKANTSQSGFTLIELLLYVSLAAIMLGVLAGFYQTMLLAREKQQVITEVEQQGAFVLQHITQTIRNAEDITSPSSGSTGSSLVLDVVASGNDPTTYDVGGGAVRVCEGGGCTARVLTSGVVEVTNFVISNLSRVDTPGVVKVAFTLTYVSDSALSVYDYSQDFYATASLR